jgi:hypothetical protein
MAGEGERWYQQPVLWLGLGILATLLAACIGLIAWASSHPDEKLQAGEEVLRVPVAPPPRRP